VIDFKLERDIMPENKDVNIEALTDLCTPWCVFVVATLRIAEYIDEGVYSISQLAKMAGCDTYALHRVLTHLVGKGLFEETRPGWFTLNEASRGLLDPASRLGLDLEGIGGRMAYAWGTLLPYVKTGTPAYQQVFGLPFWEDLEAHPEVAASFDALIGPAGHGFPNPDFQIRGGWDPIKTVVDVGGGTGAMLAGILQLHAHMRGILVDLPKTVSRAGDIFQSFGVADRVTAVGQSFFDPLPAGADIYLLRGILNDWPDPEALAVLKRCAEAARPAGQVVVLKSVSPDDEPRGIMIEMVLLGGKHRSLSEFRVLAQKAGLEISAAGQQPSGYFVVECRPG
jgi:2,7-dihydroxy-5-methyl-1-naphthoate 7-O-methyltransferase